MARKNKPATADQNGGIAAVNEETAEAESFPTIDMDAFQLLDDRPSYLSMRKAAAYLSEHTGREITANQLRPALKRGAFKAYNGDRPAVLLVSIEDFARPVTFVHIDALNAHMHRATTGSTRGGRTPRDGKKRYIVRISAADFDRVAAALADQFGVTLEKMPQSVRKPKGGDQPPHDNGVTPIEAAIEAASA